MPIAMMSRWSPAGNAPKRAERRAEFALYAPEQSTEQP